MTCKTCKYYLFQQNDMLGSCKRYPTVVNKSPTDWCGEEIQVFFEEKDKSITVTFIEPKEEPKTVYDINTDEVKPKRGRKNAGKQE